MPKYMYIGSYTREGAKGLLAEGGTARKEATRKAIESVGGTLEAYYFTFGKDDEVVILDVPSHAAISALSLTAGAGGGFSGRTIVLMEPEEIDAAAGMSPVYSPPRG